METPLCTTMFGAQVTCVSLALWMSSSQPQEKAGKLACVGLYGKWGADMEWPGH